ncbi:MAG: hypothetical protein OEX00_08935, partial [Gammaproteobacteria bacterium]|nr:hypothetical protein [Gammaproteobacteria bacterium]
MKLQKKTFFISILITLLLSACGDKASESRVLAPAEQIDYALTEGDSSVIQDEAVPLLEQQILDKIASIKALQTDTISAIYQGQSINYQVGTETAVFTYADSYYALESVFPLVNGNGGNHLALAGEKSGTRYAMFGTGLIDQYFRLGSNLAFEPHFLRTISWLLKQQPVSNTSLNVKTRVAISHFSATAETNTINWLTGKFDQWEFTSCNDGATLASCYQNKDLILLASEGALSEEAEQTKAAIAGAVAAGVPVLYQHSGSKLSNTVSTELLTNWNAFLSATNYTNDAAVWAATVEMLNSDPIANRLNDLQTMFEHLKNADFSFDFSGCFDIACQQGSDYQVNFHRGAYYLRTVLRYLENQKLQLFSLGGHELVKLAVLLADKYRQNAVFPMFVTDPDLNPFMRSQYADYAVYNLRKFNPAQRDMGNFSRSDFSHIT